MIYVELIEMERWPFELCVNKLLMFNWIGSDT